MRLSLLVVVGLTACNGVIQDGSIEEGPCVPALSTTELCLQAAAECGELETTDDCGTLVTVPSCGNCTSPLECGVGGVANVCNEPGGFIIVEALTLDRTVVRPDETLSASVTWANTSDAPVTFESLVIAARPPGGTPGGGPFEDLQPQLGATTVAAGDQITLSAQRTFSSSDTEGEWYAYATYLDGEGAWHAGSQVTFTFAACTPEAEICGDGIDQDCVDGDLACNPCVDGAIDSRCDCGGAVHVDGYCCATVWQSVACSSCTPETEICGDGIDQDCTGDDLACPVCADGPASTTRCTCAGEILTAGFCCHNQPQATECPPPVLDTSIVPEDRRTVWNPGIPGGIPPDDADPAAFPEGVGPATLAATLSPSGGDDTGAVQSALDSAAATASKTSRKVVQLGAGTFQINDLNIPSYVILRGTLGTGGERQTILNRPSPQYGSQIWIGSGDGWGAIRNLVGVHPKGSATLTVDDASGIEVGDILSVDQIRDGSYSGPSDGVADYNVPEPGDWVWTLSSLWYQRQPYSTGNGTEWLFPDSDDWRHIAQRVEVLEKNGNVLTIYDPATRRGSPLHLDFYMTPQVYRAGGNGDVTRYAGVEDLVVWPNGTNGDRIIGIHRAAFSWVKNIEIDGTRNTWSGRHIQIFGQSYRCEIRGSYFHGSSNYWQGANAYGIVYAGSECLIEDNVVRELNKPILAENSGGGNVIAYNYVDEAVIGSLTGDWQEAAISTHASFCHSDLFEGNHTPNLGSDATHGNNGWLTMFRNHATGQNSSGYATGYRRAIFSDGWNREMTSIGNVLWEPGADVDYVLLTPDTGVNPVWNAPTSVYLLGSNAWEVGTGNKPGADHWDNGQAAALFHRHLDFDYGSGEQYDNPDNAQKTLPDSLYRMTKPDFFDGHVWPWVDPAGSSHAERVWILPAKARYDAGTP